MSFDGMFRPSQALGSYADPLGSTSAYERALEKARQAHDVMQNREVKGIGKEGGEKDRRQNPQQDKKNKFSEVEEELRDCFLKRFHLELDPNMPYHLDYNKNNDRIELIDSFTQKVLFTLTPEAFIQLTESMSRNSGIMTDRSA